MKWYTPAFILALMVAPIPARAVREEFDFVVVGGGVAGCVVARRLSDTTNWTVLLLEAGDDFDTSLSTRWVFKSVPQAGSCLDAGCNEFESKVLGSAIGETYSRGGPGDYDEWEALGNSGWGYDGVLPYFKKWENNLDFATEYHGKSGPMYARSTPGDPRNENLYGALEGIGLKERDLNGASPVGFMNRQTWAHKLTAKQSVYDAFLAPVRHRGDSSLSIRTRTLVTRILFESGVATGVEYETDASHPHQQPRQRRVYAKKEVVVSAGAYKTPQLLMLSGIGPAAHLQNKGIPVVSDLPVGDNLHTHAYVDAIEYLLPPEVAVKPQNLPANSGPFQVNAFYQSKLDQPSTGVDRATFNFRFDGLGTDRRVNKTDYERYLVHAVLVAARSVGSVRLRSSDPRDDPIITLNLLFHPEDRPLLKEALRVAASLADTAAFRAANITLDATPKPLCAAERFGTDAYLECLTMRYSDSYKHPTGTCKMGPDSDPQAVVGGDLRVRCVAGLRVVDSSIAPAGPRANTIAMALMIGEKGSDLIKQSYGAPVPSSSATCPTASRLSQSP